MDEAHSDDKLARLVKRLSGRHRLPVLLQTEAAECGLVCLAMISSYFGNRESLAKIRSRFPGSVRGLTLPFLTQIGSELGLIGRPVKLELMSLGALRVPCILHWEMNHYVVLKRADRRFIVIHDPALGERKISMREASNSFTGVALELRRGHDFVADGKESPVSIRAMFGTVPGLIGGLFQIGILALVLEFTTLLAPQFMQWIVDQVIVSSDTSLLTLLGLGFLGLSVFSPCIGALRSWTTLWLTATLNVQWNALLFQRLLSLPLSWFEKRSSGDVISRFSSLAAIQKSISTQFIGSLMDGIMGAVTLLIICVYSVKLALIVMCVLGSYGSIRCVFFRMQRDAMHTQLVHSARLQTDLLESIRGVMSIKLANQQHMRQAKYENSVVDTSNADLGNQRLAIIFTFVNQILFGTARVAMIWSGANLVLAGTFSAGMLIAFAAYADSFTSRSVALIEKLVEFRMLRLHVERISDIASAELESVRQVSSFPAPRDGVLELRDVSFRYSPSDPWILDGCSIRIQPGEFVAIVGPSGSGKSTLIKLMLGLLVPTSGNVYFGGYDISLLGLARYRERVSSVMQDDLLFAGSIFENISFFDDSASIDSVEKSAIAAAIHSDIVAMPMGYQTMVGDMGASLSGGQRQRLILARAIFRNPAVLFLDEATSHLDLSNERSINEALQKMEATRIVIAHRAETISQADRVYMLVNGRFG